MKYIYKSLIVLMLFIVMSCNDLLIETPESFFVETNSFNTAKDATSAINGVYDRLRSVYNMNFIAMSDVNGEELEFNSTN
jgi:hypothetical protein